MMREPIRRAAVRGLAAHLALAVIVVLIVLAAFIDSCGVRAEAQDRHIGSSLLEHAVVACARFVCAEADALVADSAALLWTMAHRAERLATDVVSMIGRYSIPLRRAPRTERARAMQALPATFPSSFYERVVWPRAVDAARAFLAGLIPDPCTEPTVHFGGFSDGSSWRMPAGWRVVDCGPTRNTFFAVAR